MLWAAYACVCAVENDGVNAEPKDSDSKVSSSSSAATAMRAKFDRRVTKPMSSHAANKSSNGTRYHSEISVVPTGMYVFFNSLC